jgi:aerotaxis receptor
MARPKITPRDQERPFALDELFFSITDQKGIIRSGNDVFVRVAGYERVEELIGEPHNVIRHPDMPRAVFKLLWDYLGQGKVFAGYVKNVATDGAYYWVMALVVPIPGGYLSVRFKPSGRHFGLVGALYSELLAVERAAGSAPGAWRDGMRAAGERLSAWLEENGFASYDELMYTALAAEMASRRAKLSGRPSAARPEAGRHAYGEGGEVGDTLRVCQTVDHHLDDLFASVGPFLELIEKLNAKSSSLLALSDDVHLVSLNGLIASYRVGGTGAGLAAVTHDLARIAEESTALITEMTEILSLGSPLHETAFSIAAAKLQMEMAIFFANELLCAGDAQALDAPSLARTREDLKVLVDSFSNTTVRMLEALSRAQESMARLIRVHAQLKAALRRLSKVRVTGKVQASHVAGASNFQDLFERIFEQTQIADRELRELSDAIPFLQRRLPDFERAGCFVQRSLDASRGAAAAL